jgi:hypothetical protein
MRKRRRTGAGPAAAAEIPQAKPRIFLFPAAYFTVSLPGSLRRLVQPTRQETDLFNDRKPARTLIAEEAGGDDTEFEQSAMETAPQPPSEEIDYDFEKLAVPPGMTINGQGFDKARGWCHRAGLNQGELNGVLASYSRALSDPDWNSEEMNAERQRTTLNFLRERWGGEVMDRLVAVRHHIEAIGGDELVDFLDETGLGNDPFLILALDRAVNGRAY